LSGVRRSMPSATVAVPCTAPSCQVNCLDSLGRRWDREAMHLVTLRLGRDEPCTSDEARRAAGVLTAAALPEHGLEHVYAQPTPSGAVAVLFLLAPTLDDAQRAATEVARLASPVLLRQCSIRTTQIS